ncbi:MAG: hypothetical protein MGG11_11210 [Trichodesmium sp. MAG_R03]|jgi:large-conductance mechanosensitive channel|nr:hypothetical protein [Trichodesmium sp. MAG_R03]
MVLFGIIVTLLLIVGKIPHGINFYPFQQNLINLNRFQRTLLDLFGFFLIAFALPLIVKSNNMFLSKDSIKDDPPPIVSPENLKENLKNNARKILREYGKFGIDQAKEKFLEAKKK